MSKLWLSGIVIFAVYEIIKYWRGAHYIKNFIFEKEEDPENNLTYYLIPDDTYGPCTIGFFRQKIVIPESFPLHPDFVMVYKHEGAPEKSRQFSKTVMSPCPVCTLDEPCGISFTSPLHRYSRNSQ